MLTEVAEGVLVHRSELLANNAVVVRGTAGALLVDPGLTREELTCLAAHLHRLGETVAAGFATHPDWDHVLWHPELGDAPRWGTARCAASVAEVVVKPGWERRAARMLPPEIADDVPLELFGLLTPLPDGATRVPWDGPAVRVVEHPAHAEGHAALVVEERRVLVAGDMLSDVFVPMLGEGDEAVAEYLSGLDVLETLVDEVDVVVPGHGTVGDAAELRARLDLDRAYVAALHEGRLPTDPRVDSPRPGWEWVADIHAGQARHLGR